MPEAHRTVMESAAKNGCHQSSFTVAVASMAVKTRIPTATTGQKRSRDSVHPYGHGYAFCRLLWEASERQGESRDYERS